MIKYVKYLGKNNKRREMSLDDAVTQTIVWWASYGTRGDMGETDIRLHSVEDLSQRLASDTGMSFDDAKLVVLHATTVSPAKKRMILKRALKNGRYVRI